MTEQQVAYLQSVATEAGIYYYSSSGVDKQFLDSLKQQTNGPTTHTHLISSHSLYAVKYPIRLSRCCWNISGCPGASFFSFCGWNLDKVFVRSGT